MKAFCKKHLAFVMTLIVMAPVFFSTMLSVLTGNESLNLVKWIYEVITGYWWGLVTLMAPVGIALLIIKFCFVVHECVEESAGQTTIRPK